MAFGSDDIAYHSMGRVWYRLDKNWKRHDLFWQEGVHKAAMLPPCPTPEANGVCVKNTTVLHRGARMVFIDWNEAGAIENCSWLDLSVIGNIRPDWFMDDRGDATDVQYLGDQHVYHMGQPRLVKQWRKKDFANQYFTMSIQRNAGDDGVHWPLILNLPGEGFGDDSLQRYFNHELLDEASEASFLLDEAFEAGGGSCPQTASSSTGAGPSHESTVPSNLEVDIIAWRSIVYTASPVWSPPQAADLADGSQGAQYSFQVEDGVSMSACVDPNTLTVRFSAEVDLDTPVWVGFAFRDGEECLMTPSNGGPSQAILAIPDSTQYTNWFANIPATLKNFDATATTGFIDSLVPLEDSLGFSRSEATYSNGRLALGFSKSYAERPDVVYLTLAKGISNVFGYHASRTCFQLDGLADCPAQALCDATFVPASSSSGTPPIALSAARREASARLGQYCFVICQFFAFWAVRSRAPW